MTALDSNEIIIVHRDTTDIHSSSAELRVDVEKTIRSLFVTNEKNSMSFFDIWDGLEKTVSRTELEAILEDCVKKGIISISDDKYHYEFASILEVINMLPAKYRKILSMKLEGSKYEEIAEIYGVSKEIIKQMAAKGMAALIKGTNKITPVGRVKEDDYKTIFQTYNISLGEWVLDLKKPEYAYRYLAMRYKKGKAKLPGSKVVNSYKAPRARQKRDCNAANAIDLFLGFYKSLPGIQRGIILYSNEKQYEKDLKVIRNRLSREMENVQRISDITLTQNEYEMLRGYLYYAVKFMNKTDIPIDDALYLTAVTNVVGRVYDGNLWGTFFREVGMKPTHYAQTNIGTHYCTLLDKYDLKKDPEGRFAQSVLWHSAAS